MLDASAVDSILSLYQSNQLKSLIPLLPALRLKGKPYKLDRHFTMEPVFKTEVAPKVLLKCGRQVAKSTSIGAECVLQSLAQSYFNTLTVHPRFTQTRQFSNNVIRPLIEGTPLKHIMMDSGCENSIQQRSFRNKSNLYFSFAFLDAERCRGISCDKVNFDECFTRDSVTRSKGVNIPVTSVVVGTQLECFGENGVIRHDFVKAIKPKGPRDIWALTLSNGLTMRCTSNEKLYTTLGWKYLNELIVQSNSQTGLHDLSVYTRSEDGKSLVPTDVKSIEHAGREAVMDIEMEECPTLFINDIAVHNCQDLDGSFIPIIEETMSASEYQLTQYTGTPKSLDNLIEGLWVDSSRAEWVTKCESCNHWNMACIEADLLKMIGKRTVVCAKCGRPINPASGHFEHTNPAKIGKFEGYHTPQIILPMHYARERAWEAILLKMKKYSTTELYNECFGESHDSGHKLVSLTELKQASVLKHQNTLESAIATRGRYVDVALGVDWGGGGATGDSFTAIAVVGRIPGHDALHVIYMEVLAKHTSDDDQALRVRQLLAAFHCSMIAHDFGGQGAVRETLLIHAGVSSAHITPIAYVRATSSPIMTLKPVTHLNPRSYYSVDKARSLTLICAYIKKQKILFPQYDSCVDELKHFLALIAETSASRTTSENFFVGKAHGLPDDCSHAVNFACLALWYKYQEFPMLTEVDSLNKSVLIESDLENLEADGDY